jgi:hypothetical protein
MNEAVVYPDDHIIFDYAYLRAQLENERDYEVVSYIEQHFNEESYKYQLSLMLNYPFFATKILEDYSMDNENKISILLKKICYEQGGKIILIDGSRGGGKTGFGSFLINEIHNKFPKKYCYWVTKSKAKIPLPNWIKIVGNIDLVPNDSIALVDEGAIQLNSRKSSTTENKDASERLVVLRHKGITMIILVQNIKMVDVNVRRLADIRALKYGIPFGTTDGEDINKDLEFIRSRLRPRSNREVYIEITSIHLFMNFKHNLPDWWDDDKISKSYRSFEKQEAVAFKKKYTKILKQIKGSSISGFT